MMAGHNEPPEEGPEAIRRLVESGLIAELSKPVPKAQIFDVALRYLSSIGALKVPKSAELGALVDQLPFRDRTDDPPGPPSLPAGLIDQLPFKS